MSARGEAAYDKFGKVESLLDQIADALGDDDRPGEAIAAALKILDGREPACDGVRDAIEKLDEAADEADEIQEKYETALRVLSDDAGITERDLEFVVGDPTPVRALQRLCGRST